MEVEAAPLTFAQAPPLPQPELVRRLQCSAAREIDVCSVTLPFLVGHIPQLVSLRWREGAHTEDPKTFAIMIVSEQPTLEG